jgi:hypothetical protein
LLIKDVLVIRQPGLVKVTIRWWGGGSLQFDVPWPNHPESHTTDPAVIDIIRRLAPTHTDGKLAEHLNALGLRPLRANQFSRVLVGRLRESHGIQGCYPANRPVWDDLSTVALYSAPAAADMIGVERSTIVTWCKNGKLDYEKDEVRGRLWIKLLPEDIARLRQTIRPRRRRLDAGH